MKDFLNHKIKDESDFQKRKVNEVTIDFEVIKSEIRQEAFEEVKRELDRRT